MPRAPTAGRVSIVGAGPGAADLLTLRALDRIREADAVLHDALIDRAVLDLLPTGAATIPVGRRRGREIMAQDAINRRMLELARAGRRVVRLKGGDPMIFGRGAEEVEFLSRHGVAVEIVPGVTAALGAAAAFGFGLTHRAHASAVVFVTAQAVADGGPDGIDWRALARERQTVVVYMGGTRPATVAARLIEGGLSPETPAAAIRDASRPNQAMALGTLATLPRTTARVAGPGPTLIVVGAVLRTLAAVAEEAAPNGCYLPRQSLPRVDRNGVP